MLALVLSLPGLAFPVFALVQYGVGDVPTFAVVVIVMGLTAAFGLYFALAYFTWRAFRRRAERTRAPHAGTVARQRDAAMRSGRGARSRSGLVLAVVGLSAFGLAWLMALVGFFVPSQPEAPLLGVLTVLVPGVLAVAGFGVAIAGLVLLVRGR